MIGGVLPASVIAWLMMEALRVLFSVFVVHSVWAGIHWCWCVTFRCVVFPRVIHCYTFGCLGWGRVVVCNCVTLGIGNWRIFVFSGMAVYQFSECQAQFNRVASKHVSEWPHQFRSPYESEWKRQIASPDVHPLIKRVRS